MNTTLFCSKMKIKQFLLTIEEIQIQSGFVDDRPIHGHLAKTLSPEALGLLLQMHPIVLASAKKGRFQIVSGGSQLSLAKAILGVKAIIPVSIAEDPEQATLATLTEALITPLLFAQPSSRLRERLKMAAPLKNLTKIGPSLGLEKNWSKLINLALKNPHQKPAEEILQLATVKVDQPT